MHGDSASSRFFRIELLGSLRVIQHDAANTPLRIRSRRGQALIAFLALHLNRAIPRAKIAALLWEDQSETRARHSLRQLLTQLRDEIGPLFDTGIGKDSLELSSTAFRPDVSEFLECAGNPDPASVKRATELYLGELLDPGTVSSSYDEWISSERRKLHALALHVFETRIGHLTAGGSHREALGVCERLFALDPLSEATHRRLISLEAEVNGAGSAAKRAKELASLLRKELGVAPEPETAELVASLSRARPPHDVERFMEPHAANRPRLRFAAGGIAAFSLLLAAAIYGGLPGLLGNKQPAYDELVTRGFAAAAKETDAGEKDANALFQQALAMNPNSAVAKVGIGRVLIQRIYDMRSTNLERDILQAERVLSEATKDAPSYIPGFYLLGIVRKYQGRIEESIELFEQTLRLNPKHADAHAQLGHSLLFLGRGEETEHHIRKALEYSPKDGRLAHWYNFAGQADLHLERYDSAILWLEKSLETGTKSPVALALLSAAHIMQGNTTEAASAARRLKKEYPDFTTRYIRGLNVAHASPEFAEKRNQVLAAVNKALTLARLSEDRALMQDRR